MPTSEHLLDHVSAGRPVVLDVGEPRLCVLIHLDSLRSPAGCLDGITSASGGLFPVCLGFGVCLARTYGRSVSIIDIRVQKASHAREAHMPHRNYTWAAIVAKHAKLARCTSKRLSFDLRRRTSLPVSAELGAGRPMDTWNIESMHLESMVNMTPTCEIVLNPTAASDFQIRAATFAH
jgi:hypothetical protein